MLFKRLYLNHFRNYTEQEIFFSKKNIFLGKNGQGKTNLLESIYFIAKAKSVFTSRIQDLIQQGETELLLSASIQKNQQDSEISIQLNQSGQKFIRHQKKNIHSVADYLTQFPVVIFHPRDIEMLILGPDLRRTYLNQILFQLYPQYTLSFLRYQKLVKQKNEYLKQAARNSKKLDKDWLEALEFLMASEATIIVEKRVALVNLLNVQIQQFLNEFFVFKNLNIQMQYRSSPEYQNSQFYHDAWWANHAEIFPEEIRRASHLQGPSRDDVFISLNGQDIRYFSSQGQKRLTVLLMRLVMAKILENSRPVLLLDDVLLELDPMTKQLFLKLISPYDQVFLTTTDLEAWPKEWTADASIFHVKSGRAQLNPNFEPDESNPRGFSEPLV